MGLKCHEKKVEAQVRAGGLRETVQRDGETLGRDGGGGRQKIQGEEVGGNMQTWV